MAFIGRLSDFMVVDNDIMPLASGEAYVSSFSVTSQLDGSEPWDSDDLAGNDSNAGNDIVRSFDEVTYTLSYATALTNPSTTVSSATLYAEFTLPCGPDEAYFDMNTVNWMSDAVTTYYLEDGSTETTYENGDDVKKQVLTGHRTITAIPGSGDLSLGVNIGAAVNGTKLQPAFTAWMEGNEEEDKVSADVNELTISAAPMYKLQVKSSSGLDRADTYDLTIGDGSKDTIGNKDSIVGRLEGYGITVMMQNSSSTKGLKGMEFPKGDETITFDLTINETLTASDGTSITGNTSGWTPVIWDYDENAHYRNVSNGVKGKWGRTLYNYSWASGGAPANKLGQTTFNTVYDSCYDGGGWTITQDENDPLTYHVTIEDFTFDYANYNFPTLDLGGTSARVEPGTTYGSHQACFSAGYVQVILQYENASWVTEDTKANLTITANNFKVDDTSYTASATATSSYQLIKPGSINTQIWFGNPGDTSMTDYSDSNTGILGSGTSNGDAYSFQGKEVRINARTWITGDTIGKTTMEFTKWDADCFDAQGVYNVWWSNSASSSFTNGSWSNSCTMYYAGRDSNWASEKEMSDTLINNESLTFYTSPSAVTAAGQVCVGGLLVADTYNQTGDLRIGYKTYIKDTAKPGVVYAACIEGWVSAQTLTDLETTYGNLIGTDGKINTDIVRNGYDLYRAYCSKDVYATMGKSASSDAYYIKTAYDEHGNIISGTNVTACNGGNSLLICGEKTSLEIHTDREKYDMDSGQRTATVTVQPTVVVEGTVSTGSTTTTTVTIEVTLPADLDYSTGTARWGDSAIVPVETTDSSGNTVLTFTLNNVTVGEEVSAITFECAIGHAGTAEDVYNNESISLSATIESTYDHRSKSSSFGNIASTSITIIRLSSSSISKSVDKNFIEIAEDFTWTFSFYNGSATDITGTDLADVFPKNDDDLGSKFSGSYSIESIVLDFSEAPNSYAADDTDMHFYVSADYDGGRDELAMGGAPTGNGWTDLMSLSTTVDDPDKHIVTLDTSDHKDICAFYLDLGNMDAYETISIEIKVQTNGNEPGDVYNNMFCEAVEGQNSDVKSIVVTTEVIEREINGRTWIDANKNGIQDSTETGLSGVKVTLYNVDDGSETSDGQTSAEAQAKDVYGRTVEPVYTSSAGAYSFNNLPAGDYKVQFSDVNAYTYNLTEANVGTNDDIDSDATLVSAENGDLIAEIKDIKLPELEDMERALYESNHNDAGYVYDTIDIEGTKVWEDADDQDGIRPESILVYLLVDGTRMSDEHDGVIFHRVTPDENGIWTFRFTDLPRYSAIDGHEFVYNIEEIRIDGYESTVEGNMATGFTITNTHTPETIDISGSKTWDDSGDQDGYEPESITIRLLADGTEIDNKTVTADVNDNWSWTFEGLPKYRDGGEEIVYTITEDAIDHYSTMYDGYNVINTHTPDKTSVTVTKSWDDSDDQDGIRPAYVTVKLLADGEDTDKSLTLQESNNWTDTFTELDMYHDHGLAVAYTVEEVNITGYDAVITGDATTGYTVTNTHTPETIDIKVTKSWDDADDQDGIRPESITVNLFADGTPIDSATVEADANGDWNLSFTEFPKYSGGREINYTISENEVNGYMTDITGNMANGYTITNSHTPETTEVSVRKAWDDADDQDGVRPESITVHLYADGVPVTGNDGVVYVTAADDWIWSFRDLPKYRDGGTTIVYTISEDDVKDYNIIGITGDASAGFTIINGHTPETIDIEGTKIWDDANDQDGLRPGSITVNLFADGTQLNSTTVKADDYNNWQWSFEELPRNKAGQPIEYTITETAVEGYDTTISNLEEETDPETGEETGVYKVIVVNSHTPEIIDISGSKTWDDADDQDGMRPESITINLIADDDPVTDDKGDTVSVTVSAADGWSWSFKDLPKYSDGREIVYTITEDAIVDDNGDKIYKAEIDGYNVTNTHIPEVIDISGSKIWDDANDQDGIRPRSILVYLLADGEKISDGHGGYIDEFITPDESGNWSWTFTDFPKYKDGKEIAYTFTEEEVEGYTSVSDGNNIINTHTPETFDISGSKTWDDADDQDGVRPANITIRLLADGAEAESSEITAENEWAWSFTGLPKYRDGGVEIAYTITEDALDNYAAEYDGYDVTNTHTPDQTSLTVTKAWDDNNDQDGMRPESIIVTLLADGEETGRTLTLNESNGWIDSFSGLDIYHDHGEKVEYTVEEVDVSDGYAVSISGDPTIGYTLINTHIPETVEISGIKTWEDKNDQDGIRPDTITLYLFADDEVILNINVTESDDWAWKVTDLPKYRDGGEEIIYTVTEKEVTGYTTEIDGYNIINTYTPETIDIAVAKSWEDEGGYEHIPDFIDVELIADGEDTGRNIILNKADDWKGSFEGTDKYRDKGTLIEYTVREISDEALRYYSPQFTYEYNEDGSISTVNIFNRREFFDIDEEIVPDHDDADTWVKEKSVNEYNAIEFEMSTYLPVVDGEDMENGSYSINFHEVLDSELVLGDVDTDFSVYIDRTEVSSDYYVVTINSEAAPARIRTLSSGTIDDGCTFHVDIDLSAMYRDGVINDDDLQGETRLIVFFSADLEGTGLNGSYRSTVWYDIYDGDEWKYTSNEDVVEVYTYEIDIIKYDEEELAGDDYEGAALEGAVLGLYYDKNCEEPVIRNYRSYTVTSDGDGSAVFYGLEEGTYYVKEIMAPDGYRLSEDILTIELGSELSDHRFFGVFANSPENGDEPEPGPGPVPEPEPGPGPAQDTGDLTVSKSVTGSGGSTTTEFTFKVTVEGVTGTYVAEKTDADGNVTTVEITFNENGEAEFTLRHGEHITIKDLPVNAGYTVIEVDASGYTTTVIEGKASDVIIENGVIVAFQNYRGSGRSSGGGGGSGSGGGGGSSGSGTVYEGPAAEDSSYGETETARDLSPLAETGECPAMLFGIFAEAFSAMALFVLFCFKRKERRK